MSKALQKIIARDRAIKAAARQERGEPIPKKTVYTTLYPNIAPANTSITVKGEGSTLPIAIGRAIDKAFKHEKLKGKRIVLPIKIVVTEGDQAIEK
jgi:hypothetical protein